MQRRSQVFRSAQWGVLFSGLLLTFATGAGCSDDSDDNSSSDGGTNSGGSGALGFGGSAAGLNLDGSAASSGSGSIDPDAACATGAQQGKLVDVNMLVMFDRSGSMDTEDNPPRTRWDEASSALTAFFQDPGTAGLNIALRFFPHDQPEAGCNNRDCLSTACSRPLVDIGRLLADPAPADTHEQALVGAVSGSPPGNMGGQSGGTPMFAALEGAEQWATAYQAANPTQRTVVVLVTDGEPNGCNENIQDIAGLAGAALSSQNVLTYAVGLSGSNENQMNEIAAAGGTQQGIFIGGSTNAEADLLAALKGIQGQIMSCTFAMPTSNDPTRPIDPSKINVNFTPTGGAKTTIPQVPDAASCTSAGGWYYDNPAAPTQILLCPATCTTVQADANPAIEILLGCGTQIAGPR